MAKTLSTALLCLLFLAACAAEPAPTSVVAPTVAPQPAAMTPGANQSEGKQPQGPAKPPTAEGTPRSTEKPTAAPEPTAAVAPSPTTEPEPTAPSTPMPTGTATPVPTQLGSTWRGITLAPEERCSPYNSEDYPYSPSVEPKIVEGLGGVYGPYTGNWFGSIRETDIEHIVARSEAHDSGLCTASSETRARFASDLLNLTLASPRVNRHQKVAKDAAEWLPDLNQCWYVTRTIQVRLEYGLTIDQDEAGAIDLVLAGCESTEMVFLPHGATIPQNAPATPTLSPELDALALWDDNGNGRITCAEARAHDIAPVHRGHPAYEYMTDSDSDGVVCE